MSRVVLAFILLGERGRLGDLTHGFRNRSSHVDTQYMVRGLMVLAVIVLGMWVLSHVLARQENRRGRDNGLLLFLGLCKAHGLPWSQRWLLWRIARHHRLRDPARLFIEPNRLSDESLSPALRLRQTELRLLREQLYRPAPKEPQQGQPDAEPAAPTAPTVSAPSLDIPPWNAGTRAGTK